MCTVGLERGGLLSTGSDPWLALWPVWPGQAPHTRGHSSTCSFTPPVWECGADGDAFIIRILLQGKSRPVRFAGGRDIFGEQAGAEWTQSGIILAS